MKTYTHKGWYGEDIVYVLETLDDWDEYEQLLGNSEEFLKFNPNFYVFKEEFRKYIGQIWLDKDDLRYCLNGEPVYYEYKVIAIEDDTANADWYWVVQNVDDDRDIKYILALEDLKRGLK